MAEEIRVFDFTIPAGTTPNNPATLDVSFPPRIVDALQVVVPTGLSGLVGWAVLVSGAKVIPYLSADWVVTSGENITWPLDRFPDSGSWQLSGYNTGTSDHTVYFRFLLRSAVEKAVPLSNMIDDSLLQALPPIPASTSAGDT